MSSTVGSLMSLFLILLNTFALLQPRPSLALILSPSPSPASLLTPPPSPLFRINPPQLPHVPPSLPPSSTTLTPSFIHHPHSLLHPPPSLPLHLPIPSFIHHPHSLLHPPPSLHLPIPLRIHVLSLYLPHSLIFHPHTLTPSYPTLTPSHPHTLTPSLPHLPPPLSCSTHAMRTSPEWRQGSSVSWPRMWRESSSLSRRMPLPLSGNYSTPGTRQSVSTLYQATHTVWHDY